MGETVQPNPTTHTEPHAPQIFLAIPARLSSTRLPEKPLQDLCGKPMIARVVERALAFAKWLEQQAEPHRVSVLVATDDARIAKHVAAAGGHAVLTDPKLPSGTDRIFAALEPLNPSDSDLVVNIQGDEPFFSFEDVHALVQTMTNAPEIPMGTLAFPRTSLESFFKSSVVKVVTAMRGNSLRAVYFTRAPAPWPRALLGAAGTNWLSHPTTENLAVPFLHHLGVYAYRFGALRKFARELPPSKLEASEGLEQLRAIEAGWHIALAIATEEPFGIDTPEDLARAVEMMKPKNSEIVP